MHIWQIEKRMVKLTLGKLKRWSGKLSNCNIFKSLSFFAFAEDTTVTTNNNSNNTTELQREKRAAAAATTWLNSIERLLAISLLILFLRKTFFQDAPKDPVD